MNRFLIFLVYLLFVTGPISGQTADSSYDALLILEANGVEGMNMTTKEIDQNGGRIIHRYPPDVFIGTFPAALLDGLADWEGIKDVITDIVDKSRYAFVSEPGRYALEAWNNNFMGMSKSNGLDEPPSPEATPLSNCIILDRPEEVPNLPPRSNAAHGAGFEDVSEFLLGSISVAVILPESDGTNDPSTEDWSPVREAECVSEIQNGFNWLANQNLDANLSFTYHFYYGRTNSNAQTGHEPIKTYDYEDDLWQNRSIGSRTC